MAFKTVSNVSWPGNSTNMVEEVRWTTAWAVARGASHGEVESIVDHLMPIPNLYDSQARHLLVELVDGHQVVRHGPVLVLDYVVPVERNIFHIGHINHPLWFLSLL